MAGPADRQIREFALPGSTIDLSVPGSFWDLTSGAAHASYWAIMLSSIAEIIRDLLIFVVATQAHPRDRGDIGSVPDLAQSNNFAMLTGAFTRVPRAPAASLGYPGS